MALFIFAQNLGGADIFLLNEYIYLKDLLINLNKSAKILLNQ